MSSSLLFWLIWNNFLCFPLKIPQSFFCQIFSPFRIILNTFNFSQSSPKLFRPPLWEGGLCVRLGHLPEPELQPINSLKRREKKRDGPSRQRRRARRAAEKQQVKEIIEHSQDTEESIAVEAPE